MRIRGGLVLAALTLAGCSSSSHTVVVSPTPRTTRPAPQPPPPPPPPPPPARPPAPPPPPPAAPPSPPIVRPPADQPRSTAATLGIPPGHLPQAGECRVWIPGTPPGQQPGEKSRACPGIAAEAPAGSWIVYRPTRDRKLVHVRVVDARRQGLVTVVRVFNIDTGGWVKDLSPEDDEAKPDNDNNNKGNRGNNGRNRERP